MTDPIRYLATTARAFGRDFAQYKDRKNPSAAYAAALAELVRAALAVARTSDEEWAAELAEAKTLLLHLWTTDWDSHVSGECQSCLRAKALLEEDDLLPVEPEKCPICDGHGTKHGIPFDEPGCSECGGTGFLVAKEDA